MKKKIIIIVAAVVLALAILITGAVLLLKNSFGAKDNKDDASSAPTSSASDSVNLEPSGEIKVGVDSVEGKVGDTITVPVKVTDNPGFVAAQFKFKYDEKSLKFTGCEKGDFSFNFSDNADKGLLNILCDANEDVKGDGVVVNLKFEVLNDAKTSDIEMVTDEETMLVNWNEEFFTVGGSNGKVTIK